MVRAVPVIALPLAVHLYLIISRTGETVEVPLATGAQGVNHHQTLNPGGPQAELEPAPEPIRNIDPTRVENPELGAARLMAHVASTPSSKSYYEGKVRALTPATANA